MASTDVLLKYTYGGDANLDGVVNLRDFNRFASHFGLAGETWSDGDFNYDGLVNFADLLTLARNYNQALPAGPIPGSPAGFDADLSAAFATAVPEPAALAVGLVGAAIVATRRRRRS